MDIFANKQEIHNVAHNHAHETYMKHANIATSMRMWVEENKNEVFYYHDGGDAVPEELWGGTFSSLLASNIVVMGGPVQTWTREWYLH